MNTTRSIHPHFQHFLDFKDQQIIDLYRNIRNFVFSFHPTANEIVYNNQALVSVYSLSDRLTEAFCMIPIYSNHINLGFHKGAFLNDPTNILQGNGKQIRHIRIHSDEDYNNTAVKNILNQSIEFALNEMDSYRLKENLTISKITFP